MTQKKTYFLLSLVGVSGYVIQLSLMFLTEYWDFDTTLLKPQTSGSVLGVDVSFSYLGMHIFWPYVISFCLLGYHYSNNADNQDGLYAAFSRSRIARFGAYLFIPLLALSLLYFTISGFFLEGLEKSLRFGNLQHPPYPPYPPYPPSTPERVAVMTIITLVTNSFLLSLYSLIKLNTSHNKNSK